MSATSSSSSSPLTLPPILFVQLSDVDENGLSPSVPYLKGLRNGDIATSRIKQVRSGPASTPIPSLGHVKGVCWQLNLC